MGKLVILGLVFVLLALATNGLTKITDNNIVSVYDKSKPVYSVELVENTEQCVFNGCFAIYEICNNKNEALPLSKLGFDFYNTGDRKLIINSQIYEESVVYESKKVPVYEDCSRVYTAITGEKMTDTRCLVRYDDVTEQKRKWSPFVGDSIIEAGKCERIKITGYVPVNSVIDHVLKYDDLQFKEFAYWNSTFDHCKNITITSGVGQTLNDFPYLINLTYNSDYGADYSKIRFVNESCYNGGVQLSHEIENYTGSRAYVWVKIPTLPATGTTFSIYYGNTEAEDGQNVADVWSNGFQSVYHFAGDGSDSAGTNPLTEGDFSNCNYTYLLFTPGVQLTTAGYFYEEGFPLISNFPTATMSLWISSTRPLSSDLYYFDWVGSAHTWVRFDQSVTDVHITDGVANNLNYDLQDEENFYYWTTAFKWGTNITLLKNGKVVDNNVGAVAPTFTGAFAVGGYYGGTIDNPSEIDEVRISNASRSPAWVFMEYQNMINNSVYVTFGAEEDAPQPPPNYPPVGYNTTITPATPLPDNDLNCSSIALDSENTTLRVLFSWHINNVPVGAYNGTRITENNTLTYTDVLLPSNETSEGNNVTCYALWDENGGLVGNITSANVTITSFPNQKPVMHNVNITPASPIENQTLNCSAIATDDDASFNFNFSWYLNNNLQSFASSVFATNNTRTYTGLLFTNVTRAGDNVTCSVIADDGENFSLPINMSVVVLITPNATTKQILSEFNPNSIEKVFLLFLFVFVWLAMITIGWVFRNPVFMGAGFLVGILTGFMFVNVHWGFTLVIVLINGLMMFGLFAGGDV